MPTRTARPGNLPAETTSFIGRRHEMAELRKKLTGARLITLVGPGGVGKTRLAVRMAGDLGRGFRHGVWLVELADLNDPGIVANAVLAALDLRDQAAAEPAELLFSFLREKQLLLVLDNCEHLLQAAAELSAEILKASPGVRVIATSREPLHVAGEHVLPVPPLDLPAGGEQSLQRSRQSEAVALFIERAAAAAGSFDLTVGNQAAVVDVCRRLDGLPLAIELAAVRTRALTPEQIRERLDERFDLLTGGSRAALPRHQTLRTTIEWSYDLLAPTERTLLYRLCVFAGRFTLDDVEAVCADDDLLAMQTLDLLSSLLDKSLVIKEEVAGSVCYRLHETMREYARLQLQAASEEEAVEQRCADYYVTKSLQFAAEGRFQLLDWLGWMDIEIENIRAVLRRCVDRGDVGRGLTLATGLVWYWVTRATNEGARWLDELLTLAADFTPVHPWTYFARGFLAVLQFDPAAGTSALDVGVSAARRADLPNALSQSLSMASIAANMAGDRASSRRLLDEARRVADGLGEVGALLMVHEARALNGLMDAEFVTVAAAASDGARLSREVGDMYTLGMMLMNHGFAALMTGDSIEAERHFTDGVQVASQVDDRVALCYLLGGLGCCAAYSREPRLAAQLLGAMDNLRTEVGATLNVGMAPAFEDARASATAALGAAKFTSESHTGAKLALQAAIRLALRQGGPAARAEPARAGVSVIGERPAQVARLIAEGLSNKDIGSRLFISERTVESHVRNILNKLGFNSRAQIAGWVAASEHEERI